MEDELRNHLAVLAETYAKARGLEMVTVARLAAGDWRFFDRVDSGDSSFTIRKYDAIIRWFSGNWPAGLNWPTDVPRPAIEVAA